MAYYLNLFSPETCGTFSRSDHNISGFRSHKMNAAQRIHLGHHIPYYRTQRSSLDAHPMEVLRGEVLNWFPNTVWYHSDKQVAINVVRDKLYLKPRKEIRSWSHPLSQFQG